MRRPVELTVLEAKDRLGGVLWTDRFDGFTLEGGPDSFITNKPWGIDLCHRLGLSDQLIETDASHRRSFVVEKRPAGAGARGLRLDGAAPADADPDDADSVLAGQASLFDGSGHSPPR